MIHPAIQRLTTLAPNGVFEGIPAAEYHRSNGVSRSQLDLLSDSPFVLLRSLTHPQDFESTPEQILGTLVHHFVLFNTLQLPPDFVVVPDSFTRVTKAGKEFAKAHEGKTLIKDRDVIRAQNCRESIMRHERLRGLIEGGKPEVSVYADTEHDGLRISRRCRPDLLPGEGFNVMLDLKTTSKFLIDETWKRECHRWGYFHQAAYYLDTCKDAGVACDLFGHIVVMTDDPYMVRCYWFKEHEIAEGREQYKRNLSTLVNCIKTDTWGDESAAFRPLTRSEP